MLKLKPYVAVARSPFAWFISGLLLIIMILSVYATRETTVGQIIAVLAWVAVESMYIFLHGSVHGVPCGHCPLEEVPETRTIGIQTDDEGHVIVGRWDPPCTPIRAPRR